jgi:hypothetical protein
MQGRVGLFVANLLKHRHTASNFDARITMKKMYELISLRKKYITCGLFVLLQFLRTTNNQQENLTE